MFLVIDELRLMSRTYTTADKEDGGEDLMGHRGGGDIGWVLSSWLDVGKRRKGR